MIGFLQLSGERIQQTIRAQCKSPVCQMTGRTGHGVEIRSVNKQGRWRSITPAALPCPDIKIGFRHPVRPSWPVQARGNVIHFTIGQKSSSRAKERRPIR
jgi:hypothetical protein